MKPIAAIALLTLAGVFGAGNVPAQDHVVQANLPFDFTVADRLLPAGTYTITTVRDGVIAIQNRNRPISILTTTYPDNKQSENSGQLVFEKYAGHYFLREIQVKSAALNVDVSSGRAKRIPAQEANTLSQNRVVVATNAGN